MTAGIVSWGVYLPFWRLERATIAKALGAPAGRGARAVASYDEDTTTLGVEAARRALAPHGVPVPEELLFSTPEPAYQDKTNATTVHAALGLPPSTAAYDLVGSVRSGLATLLAGLAVGERRPTLAVVSEIRTGLAGGADERDSGDGSVAFVCGTEGVVLELVGRASATEEFLDRWRTPGDAYSRQWEERFGEEAYLPLANAALTAALKDAGVTADAVDHVVVAGLHSRALRSFTAGLGAGSATAGPDVASKVGNLGAAHLGLGLAEVLERAEPGQLVLTALLADGADVLLWRTTEALPAARQARSAAGLSPVAEQLDAGRRDLSYANFLTWRGQLVREPPRRPEPGRPDAPAMRRSEGWKYGFDASRCLSCGFRHLPPTRVCLRCHSVDQMEPERLADAEGTVATFTIDHLAYSLSPPIIAVVVDFDGGGRFRCELTDADADALHIGDRVEMTFRRLYTAEGIHNYFWKARPVAHGAPAGEARQGTGDATVPASKEA